MREPYDSQKTNGSVFKVKILNVLQPEQLVFLN